MRRSPLCHLYRVANTGTGTWLDYLCMPWRALLLATPLKIPTQLWHLPQVVPSVVQTTDSVHPAYTAQLLTLHHHRANNQYRTANQILPTLRVSSSTQATLEQSPIQVLTELNVAWLQWSCENWYFQVDKPLRPAWLLIDSFHVESIFFFYIENSFEIKSIYDWHNFINYLLSLLL